jgi:arylsulfatase A-like enzyme
MDAMADRMPNVFVFVLDTIRVDRVKGMGAPGEPANFLEKILHRGSLFANFIVSGNSTRISVNALFNGFYGGTTGLNYHYNCDADFHASQVITLTELLRHHGYRTIGVSQGDVYLPLWGFDRFQTFEGDFDLDDLAGEIASSDRPVFAYLHFSNLHDLAFGSPERMTLECYDEHLDELADELKGAWQRLVGDDDVAVVVSDHGCNLRERFDPDWRFYVEDEPTGGIFLGEPSIRGICSIVAPGRFPARSLDGVTRSIDLLPTLLDGLGLERPQVQGRSLWPVLTGHELMPALDAFSEAGGIRLDDGQAICRGLRDSHFKYNRYEIHGEQLFDLVHDPDATRDLIGQGHPQEQAMRERCAAQTAENARGVAPWYAQSAALATQVLAARPPWPKVQRGPRESCFKGLIDDAVRDYLKAHVAEHVPRWKTADERILLYSASEHAGVLLDALPVEGRELLVGVVDGNPALAGKTWRGLPVYAPDSFEDVAGASLLIVAHHFFAQDMYARVKQACDRPIRVVNLYHLDRDIPLWWDRDG